ncbi:M20/M25/M40 family metallo-hydrolase [bacterium]|nr:M20/M25/M40 family metallo-hydrolase [bacterium]
MEHQRRPSMEDQAIHLLRRLTEAHGVAGFEDEVRDIFRDSLSGTVIEDNLGSLFVRRDGGKDRPVVMLAAHFDEVGYAVQSITAEGYVHVALLGGIWSHTALGQRVRILTADRGEVIGIVASKPIHFTTETERKQVVPIEDLLIDIGARSEAEARERFGLRIGQPITFDSEFIQLEGTSLVVAKALDNRAGVALVMTVAEMLADGRQHNTVFCGATCQEELRGRGAQTSARLIQPDIALVIEGIPADDYKGSKQSIRQGELGKGVQIRIMDGSAIMNRKLNQLILDVAEENGIPTQLSVRRSGGTDAGPISLNDSGVPVAVLGIPVRYVHTANSMMDMTDFLNAVKLTREVIARLDETACAGLVEP